MRLRPVHGLVVALLVTFAVHLPVLGNGFASDDNHIVRARYAGSVNPMVAELQPVASYFATEYWAGAGQSDVVSNPLYRPLTVWSFALTHAVWPGAPNERGLGPAPGEAFPHHLLNVLLQVGATALVYLLVLRLTRSAAASVCAALVFGLQALHTEVVATCVGRADLFAFCFGLGALLVWLRGQDCGLRRGAWLFGTSSVLLFFAFCSKESALPWLAAFPLFGVYLRWNAGGGLAATIGRQLGLTAVAGALPFVAWYVLRAAAFESLPDEFHVPYAANPLFHLPAADRLPAAVALWGHGLYQTFVP